MEIEIGKEVRAGIVTYQGRIDSIPLLITHTLVFTLTTSVDRHHSISQAGVDSLSAHGTPISLVSRPSRVPACEGLGTRLLDHRLNIFVHMQKKV